MKFFKSLLKFGVSWFSSWFSFNDLKALIRITVHGIEAQLLSDNYISEMEDPKNKK